ncbi:hypothetical protein R3W88_020040 [Solanum pinnatisectum]|uniref:Cell differentiation protein rcd1 n=1 Tax=Solanum pinnatisectum TaxID=50273 RepID=A0AAV9KMH3_9SOLN|nr:hypothetical protein R3W88_020040 [Solanum pinnatisectum]
MLSMREATRACRALALFQVMADNPETRKDSIKAKIPHYFYPFLKFCGDDKPLEYVRITTLGVLGALTKFDDTYGSHALHLFLESEVVPLCLKCMDACELILATLTFMKILTQERGLTYCCATPTRFFAIVQVLRRVVEKLSPKPCLLFVDVAGATSQYYGCLYFPPIEERKRIAKKAASSSKGKGIKGKK